jgi:hypothetical protein
MERWVVSKRTESPREASASGHCWSSYGAARNGIRCTSADLRVGCPTHRSSREKSRYGEKRPR